MKKYLTIEILVSISPDFPNEEMTEEIEDACIDHIMDKFSNVVDNKDKLTFSAATKKYTEEEYLKSLECDHHPKYLRKTVNGSVYCDNCNQHVTSTIDLSPSGR